MESNNNSFDKAVEARVLKQEMTEPNFKIVNGLLCIVKLDGTYRIATAGGLIVKDAFETIKQAEAFIKKNSIEIAIRAAVLITKKMNHDGN